MIVVVSVDEVRQEKAVEADLWLRVDLAERMLAAVPAFVEEGHTSEDLFALVERVEKVVDVVRYVADVLRDMARVKVGEELEERIAESWRLPRTLIFGECRRKGIDSASAAETRLRGC